jgi:hypothetical protein
VAGPSSPEGLCSPVPGSPCARGGVVAALWMLVNGSRLAFEHSERGRRRPGPPDAMILAPLDSVAPFTGLLLGQPTLAADVVRQFEEATGGASASADGASAVDEAAE